MEFRMKQVSWRCLEIYVVYGVFFLVPPATLLYMFLSQQSGQPTLTLQELCPPCSTFDLTKPAYYDYNCVKLHASPSTRICVYPADEDKFISKRLIAEGKWEWTNVELFQGYLKRHPGVGVIDLGSNLGVYSLTAAKLGAPVLAVEPNIRHVRRFHKAVKLEGLEDRVTVLVNAVSDTRTLAKIGVVPDNQGASVIQHVNPDGSEPDVIDGGFAFDYSIKFDTDENNFVKTILMDDLVEYCHFDEAVMKIDIEGHEHRAFHKAERLFDTVRIPVILMEWMGMREIAPLFPFAMYEEGLVMHLITFLCERHYQPMDWDERVLDTRHWQDWPDDVLWVKDLDFFTKTRAAQLSERKRDRRI